MPTTYYHTVNGRIRGESTAGVRTDYLTDALGSVVATVNSSAAVVNTYRYKPYGERLAKTGAGADPRFGWTGDTGSRRTERSFSDQYNQRRHLATSLAHWSVRDSLWPAQHPYQYALANPVLFTDATGTIAAVVGALVCPDFPCKQDLPDCGNPGQLLECFKELCPGCSGGEWVDCRGSKCPGGWTPGEYRVKCKGSEANCNAIAKQIAFIDSELTGPGSGGVGDTWACTVCCKKTGGTAGVIGCCSTSDLCKGNVSPCVAYCLLDAHEGLHVWHCSKPLPREGDWKAESEALACERLCLMKLWNDLNCKPPPPPNQPPGTTPCPSRKTVR